MKKIVLLSLVFVAFSGAILAQNGVVVTADSVAIHTQSNLDSRIIKTVYKGATLQISGSLGKWFIVREGGFVNATGVDVVEEFIKVESKKPSTYKEANEYTEQELLLMLLQETKAHQQTRDDVRVIKNIQVASVVVAGVLLVITLIQTVKTYSL